MRAKAELTVVDADHQEAITAVDEASKQVAPMVQRLATHRDRMDLAIKELESERFDIISKRDQLRRQAEAVEKGFSMHLEDIEATLKLYEEGLNTVEVRH